MILKHPKIRALKNHQYLVGRRFSGAALYISVAIDLLLDVLIARRRTVKTLPRKTRKIIICKLDHLGDFLMATPFLEALRKIYPKTNIALFHNSTTIALVQMYRHLFESTQVYDTTILNRKCEYFVISVFRELISFFKFLWLHSRDTSTFFLDLRPYSSFLFPVYPFLRCKHIVAFGLRGYAQSLSGIIPFQLNRSTGQNFLDLLNQHDGKSRVYRRPCPPKSIPPLPSWVKDGIGTDSFLVVQFCAGSPDRDIRIFRWLEVLETLSPYFLFVILGTNKKYNLAWLDRARLRIRFWNVQTSVPESLAIVNASAGVLSVDSYCAHLGLMFRKKTAVLLNSLQGGICSYPYRVKNLLYLRENDPIDKVIPFFLGSNLRRFKRSRPLARLKIIKSDPDGAQLTLNGRFLLQNRPTGTHRSAYQFFQGLSRQWPGRIILATDSRAPQAKNFLRDNPNIILASQFCVPGWYSHFREQIIFPFLASKGLQLHGMGTAPFLFTHSRQVMFVHGLNFKILGNTFNRFFRYWYHLACTQAARRSHHIVCFTAYVKELIVCLTGVPQERISVIPQGPGIEEALLAQPLPSVFRFPFFMCVGSLQPHKNLKAVLQAWALWRNRPAGLQLKIIGRPQKNFVGLHLSNDLLEQPGVSFTGYLSDEELVRHYQHALGFVYPSLEEGFGLPVVEAFHAGCPVITSNASCLPEVAGDAALLVDPNRPGEITQALQRIYRDPNLRNRLIQAGRKRAELFSWKLATRRLTDLLLEIASK